MRLLVHVEGETEETFVNSVLCPHLAYQGYSSVAARLIGERRHRSQRGGGISWQSARKGILIHLKGDTKAVATMMVDYYGMPQSQSKGWPGRARAVNQPFEKKAGTIQNALAEDIRHHMGKAFNTDRFIPYVSMHEFEALLFSDCCSFADSIGHPEIGDAMQSILNQFGDPEKIDDSQETAPSKRILSLIPTYDKVAMGAIAIQDIGLNDIRCHCRHFAHWLTRLEAAAQR